MRIKYGNTRLQSTKECWWCGREGQLDHHEFLNGPDKPHAVADGLWVWACRMCHSLYQNDSEAMLEGRKVSQKIYELEIGSHEDYMRRYRKNYL